MYVAVMLITLPVISYINLSDMQFFTFLLKARLPYFYPL